MEGDTSVATRKCKEARKHHERTVKRSVKAAGRLAKMLPLSQTGATFLQIAAVGLFTTTGLVLRVNCTVWIYIHQSNNRCMLVPFSGQGSAYEGIP